MYFSESTRYPRKGESAIRDMESRLGMVKIFSYGDEGGGNVSVKHGVFVGGKQWQVNTQYMVMYSSEMGCMGMQHHMIQPFHICCPGSLVG